MKHTLFPDEVGPASPVGGKARALADMDQSGLPIPAWFVVLPSAFDASIAPDVSTGLDTREMQRRASSMELADDVAAEVEHALARLAPTEDYFAVRSSALEEDSPGRSFAGQLDSALFVARAEVPAKIASVWASGFSERLSCYRREAGLGPLTEAPAVIVQRMIGGDVSGVAFSADPVSGRRAISVVSAVPGLGSALVSGEAVADTWRVELGGKIVERSVESKIVMHLADAAAPDGIRTVPVPPERTAAPALADAQVREVARLARQAEAH